MTTVSKTLEIYMVCMNWMANAEHQCGLTWAVELSVHEIIKLQIKQFSSVALQL